MEALNAAFFFVVVCGINTETRDQHRRLKLVPLTHPMIWSIQLQLSSFLELTTYSESLPAGSSPRLNHHLIVYAFSHCNLAWPTFYMASMNRTHMCILRLGFCECETEPWDSVRNGNTQQWRRKLEMVSKAAFRFRCMTSHSWSQFSVKNLHLIGQTNSWTVLLVGYLLGHYAAMNSAAAAE